MKTGLVLEGGSVRGHYTAGVLDVFMEHNMKFDGVIGVSAGGIHGCSFISNQHGRSLRYFKKYSQDWRFMSFKSLILTGDIVGTKFCYDDIPNHLDPYDYEAFNASGTDFFVTCTDVETGKAVYFKINDMKEEVSLLRASASMPYVSQIVEYKGYKLLDGGCSDSIPVKAFMDFGYDKPVVVLTRHEGYRKKEGTHKLMKLFYRKYPKFQRALFNRGKKYNKTLDYISKLEAENKIYVIRPSKELNISRLETDPAKIQEVYDIGHRDALMHLEKLNAWLTKNNEKGEI